MNIPDYLNEDLLKKSIKCGLGCEGEVVIKNFTIKIATNTGDNFLSDVYRINVEYSALEDAVASISLIIKCMPDSGSRGPVLDDLKAYDKEVDMYSTILPELSASVEQFFAAKCFYATQDPIKMIVFQDLKALDYKMADRYAGQLDFNHCDLIMKKIGKFHAASMVYAQENPDKMRQFNYSIFDPKGNNTDEIPQIYEKGMQTLTRVADTKWPDFDREIVEKLKKLKSIFLQKLEECINQKNEDGVNVLNHGDLWNNNMMFRYDEQTATVKDVVFVDYQVSFYTSPGLDLNYFINTCPTHEIREHQRNDLIKIYYKSLVEGLSRLNHEKIPTYEDILDEIQKFEFYGFATAISILALILMEKNEEDAPNFEKMADEDTSAKIRERAFNGKRYKETIQPILRRFNDLNVLDL